jgi:pimeloyl-ACP methyl ester carboxylesterase
VTTFAFVHGAYGCGAQFAPLAAELEARGHRAVAPDLPIEDRAATFPDYADAVLAALAEAGADGDVHVVGHSMGGVTAALVAARRSAPLTYLAALVPVPGEPLTGVLAEAIAPEVAAAEVRGEDGLRRLPRAVADELMFPGIALRGQAVAPYFDPFPLDAVPDGRYLLCTRDGVVAPAYGRRAAPGELVELDCGHVPQLELPAGLADVLVAA